MFWNIYKKRILISLRDKDILIWAWLFPLMLATLFHFAFANLDASGTLKTIQLGVIDNAAYQQDLNFQNVLESVSGESEDSLFKLWSLKNQEEADDLLENGEIDGYVIYEDMPLLMISTNGLRQTIIKGFLDRYLQTKDSVLRLIEENPEAYLILPELLTPLNYTERILLSNSTQTKTVGYFYALLAMACLYGGFQGLTVISQMQANLSAVGARVTVSSAGRFRLVAYDLLGGLTTHFLQILTLVAYINFALGISFGSQLWFVLFTCLISSLLGISFGAMISATSKLKEQVKIAILIVISNICCFLAGLMIGDINYVVMQKAPVVAWLNPAARISDAFYCLYYYDNYERFFLNIGIIFSMAIAMLVITAFFVRRQEYESL
ncbi:MAG: ABC transporter permease [Lachnospiraceae bacterium]|nr:ABC transporter permease [Lachnospiraceae bacterium]